MKYVTHSGFLTFSIVTSRPQWPQGLGMGLTADRLMALVVRISPAAWMSVCFMCCQIEVSAYGGRVFKNSVVCVCVCDSV